MRGEERPSRLVRNALREVTTTSQRIRCFRPSSGVDVEVGQRQVRDGALRMLTELSGFGEVQRRLGEPFGFLRPTLPAQDLGQMSPSDDLDDRQLIRLGEPGGFGEGPTCLGEVICGEL